MHILDVEKTKSRNSHFMLVSVVVIQCFLVQHFENEVECVGGHELLEHGAQPLDRSMRGELGIGKHEDVLERMLVKAFDAIRLEHAPREPIDLTGRAIVDDQTLLGEPAGRVPRGGDHHVGRHVDGYDVGGGLAVAEHALEQACARCRKECRRSIEVVNLL